jgi:hypothetical protein
VSKNRFSQTNKSPTYSLREREDRLAHLNVYKELERFELSSSKSPASILAREQALKDPSRAASFSPLRNRENSPQKHEIPSLYPQELQDKIRNSCDKLAMTLGLSN